MQMSNEQGNCGICKREPISVFCETCGECLCSECDMKKHTYLKNKTHGRSLMCEECYTKESSCHCMDCEQSLCTECEKLIHKGGTRRQHKRNAQDPILSIKTINEGHSKPDTYTNINGNSPFSVPIPHYSSTATLECLPREVATLRVREANSSVGSPISRPFVSRVIPRPGDCSQEGEGTNNANNNKSINHSRPTSTNTNISHNSNNLNTSNNLNHSQIRENSLSPSTPGGTSVSAQGEWIIAPQREMSKHARLPKINGDIAPVPALPRGASHMGGEFMGMGEHSFSSNGGSILGDRERMNNMDNINNMNNGNECNWSPPKRRDRAKNSPNNMSNNWSQKDFSFSNPSRCKEEDSEQLFPVSTYQQYPPCKAELLYLVSKLKEQANNGYLLLSEQAFRSLFTNIPSLSIHLEIAQKEGIILICRRHFGHPANHSTSYISLRLTTISLQSLYWVLASLKRDQMTPTDRVIQSRIKEAFGIKIYNAQWERILHAIQGTPGDTSEDSIYIYIYIYIGSNTDIQVIQFDVEESADPLSGVKQNVIYPRGEKWEGIDQLNPSTILNTQLYADFKLFMKDYFTTTLKYFWNKYKQTDTNTSNTSNTSNTLDCSENGGEKRMGEEQVVEEGKAIPGGRYGCAQFVKACGPPLLRNCSLGMLSLLVQTAINEDILRYIRTLLIWTNTLTKNKLSAYKINCLHSPEGKV